jgi:hypothetical protein
VTSIYPSSGPVDGFTDLLVTGKGFTKDLEGKMKCRFGIDADYSIVDAEVIDYTKLACRTPADFHPEGLSTENYSVNFGIGANDEDFLPWTKDFNRYRYYKPTAIDHTDPEEVTIGKMTEIFVIAAPGSSFSQRKCLLTVSL